MHDKTHDKDILPNGGKYDRMALVQEVRKREPLCIGNTRKLQPAFYL